MKKFAEFALSLPHHKPSGQPTSSPFATRAAKIDESCFHILFSPIISHFAARMGDQDATVWPMRKRAGILPICQSVPSQQTESVERTSPHESSATLTSASWLSACSPLHDCGARSRNS